MTRNSLRFLQRPAGAELENLPCVCLHSSRSHLIGSIARPAAPTQRRHASAHNSRARAHRFAGGVQARSAPCSASRSPVPQKPGSGMTGVWSTEPRSRGARGKRQHEVSHDRMVAKWHTRDRPYTIPYQPSYHLRHTRAYLSGGGLRTLPAPLRGPRTRALGLGAVMRQASLVPHCGQCWERQVSAPARTPPADKPTVGGIRGWGEDELASGACRAAY